MRVVSFKGRPPGQDVVARFGKAGGTIGRSDNNTLVLPDPERYISRVHASISFQGGGFVLVDNGTKNATLVNGQPIGQGRQARLSDGDTIKLGDYILAITLVNTADPFGDPVGAPPYPTPLIPPDAELIPRPREASIDADPWSARPQSPPAKSPPERQLPADALAGIRPSEPNVEDLFELQSSRGADLLGPDPFRAGSGTPAAPGSVDPLAYLTGAQKPAPRPVVPDHGPEIFSSYLPPAAKPDPAMGIAGPSSASGGVSDVPRVESEELRRSRPAPRPPVGPRPDEALLRAFLKGAGIPDVQLPKGLTPETMEGFGRLLREAVHGTLDLLHARGLTKSEMRIDATRIMAEKNNPLKFAPTVEAALTQLLGPRVPGFMPPVHAMREAYDDLRAHQIGFLAGMRAALEDVLKRFEPEALQKRLVDPGLLDSLLPMNRKAKLWEAFLEYYRHIAGEAQEDFNAVFGKAFLSAYEAQVKQLRAQIPPG
jgi:FHA domain-containing protein